MRHVSSYEKDPERFCTTGDAAHILKCSAGLVRYLEVVGRLRGIRTVGGVRLYLLRHVEGLAHERAAKARWRDKGRVSGKSAPVDRAQPLPKLAQSGGSVMAPKMPGPRSGRAFASPSRRASYTGGPGPRNHDS